MSRSAVEQDQPRLGWMTPSQTLDQALRWPPETATESVRPLLSSRRRSLRLALISVPAPLVDRNSRDRRLLSSAPVGNVTRGNAISSLYGDSTSQELP